MSPAAVHGAPIRGTKRALLTGLVEENLDVLAGRRPAPRRVARRRMSRAAWLSMTAVLLLAASWAVPLAVGAGGEPVMVLGEAGRPVRRLASLPARVAPHMASSNRLASGVLPLEVRRVVLDPGHGGRDTGTTAPGGLTEAEVALDVARRLRVLLEGRGTEVLMTREGDQQIVLAERAAFANRELSATAYR